jgi:hypothetical protein
METDQAKRLLWFVAGGGVCVLRQDSWFLQCHHFLRLKRLAATGQFLPCQHEEPEQKRGSTV